MYSRAITEVGMTLQTESQSAGDATSGSEQNLTLSNLPEGSSSPLAAMFPNDLVLFRQRKRLNQRQAAVALGITRNRLSLWEGGKALPSWSEARRLTAFYQAALSELYPNPLVRQFIAQQPD